MTLPTTAEALHDLLLADQVISNGLGTYTFKDGTVLPAIGCYFGNEHLPPGTQPNGIEIAITRLPDYGNQSAYDGVLLNPSWRIYVVAWHDAATLQAMAERVMALLPGSTARDPGAGRNSANPVGAGLSLQQQLVVSWTNPTAFVEA